MTGDTFTGNTGGGLNCEDDTPDCEASITRSTFTRNTGSAITSVSPVGDITVTDSTFRVNSAAHGGGIDVNGQNGVTLTVTGDTFTGNSATAAGGAIYDTNADVTATGDTFTGNTAPSGGAIANEGEATVTVTGSTFRRNAATSAGGAIYNQCVAVVTGTTFDQNTAGSGGGAIEQEAGCFGILSFTLTLSLTRSQVLGSRIQPARWKEHRAGDYASHPASLRPICSLCDDMSATLDGIQHHNRNGPPAGR